MERFASWYRAESGRREIVPLLGNHDVPYYMRRGSASFARVRAQAPGFKPGAQRRVHRFAVRVPPPLGVGRNHGITIPILYANVVESAL